jgi:peptidoglycan/xylan/chitin deacetylase (PgdA/CDA1 family)
VIKKTLKRLMAAAPAWQSLGTLARASGVRILMYHRIGTAGNAFPNLSTERFTSQMEWLARNCTLIAPGDIASACADPPRARPPVLVTFDDGYRDYHDVAYPILKRLGIPSVVFLATDLIDRGGLVWTDVVYWAFKATAQKRATLPWDAGPTDLDAAAVERSKAFLKSVADGDRRRHVDALLERLDVAGRYEALERQMLSWDEVRATMDLTSYGGHTHTHPIMSRLPDADLEREIATCRQRITDETGVSSPYFAYPNGTRADFDDRTKAALRRHGFTVAFSTIEGVNGRSPDLMALLRLPTGARDVGDFAWLVAGLAA